MKTKSLIYTLFVAFVCVFIEFTQGVFFPSIQWTPDNPIIQNLNGKTRKVRSDDGLHIWCPKDYTQLLKTKGQIQPANLYFTLYKVETKEEFDACDATKGKQLLTCDDPEKVGDVDYKLLLFQENPIFGVVDPYIPGNTYYFIGTSGGRHGALLNKIGGQCASKNLKFAIYVCGKNEKNCNIEVHDGGWTMWRKNEETGMCVRNCTNPEPQNGGEPCRGPSSESCSKVIIERTKNEEIEEEVVTTIEPPIEETTEITTTAIIPTTGVSTKRKTTIVLLTTSVPKIVKSTTPRMPSLQGRAKDEHSKKNDDVTLSMKEAVLTFIGLFILGCTVGIIQVLAILHLRNKRSQTKQPEPVNPVNV